MKLPALSLLAVVLLVPRLGSAAVKFDSAIAPAAFAAKDIETAFAATGQTTSTVNLELDVTLAAQAYATIDFWRRVMRHAKDRGIEVHFITWSIWMNSLAPAGWYRRQENLQGDAGLYGINNDQTNPAPLLTSALVCASSS